MGSAGLTRKQFLFTTGAPLAIASASVAAAPARRPRNVLFLISDQHRPGAMSWLGDRCARTPHLDKLASSGVAFRSAYTANPVCGPARASLLTGLYTHNHGAYTNDIPWRNELRTIAHRFGAAGYLTGLIGKAHFGDAQTHGFDYRIDFNDWYQYLGPKTQLYADEIPAPNGGCGLPQVPQIWESGDPWKNQRSPGAQEAIVVGRPSVLEESDHFDNFVARESVRFIKRNRGKQPFLLLASFLKPHAPFTPAGRFIDPNWQNSIGLPDTYGKVDLESVPQYIRARITRPSVWTALLESEPAARKRLAMYYGSIAQMDDCVGQVLAALQEAGLAEDTIVIYTADHGDMCGEHGLWDKLAFYESSAGVPLMIRAPGVTRAGEVCDSPVSTVALVPTLLDLCGLDIASGMDEPSFSALLRDPSSKRDRAVFSEMLTGTPSPKYMIRRREWKYCIAKSDSPELYNLSDDTKEMSNLARFASHRSTMEWLHAELVDWYPGAGG
jgi:choline-sulfatase